jgi:hypothetical protein
MAEATSEDYVRDPARWGNQEPKTTSGEGTMKLPRRKFLHLAAGAAGAAAHREAQNYPMRPVRLIVGYVAGGGLTFSRG